MFHYIVLDNEVQSDSFTRIFDQHDASGQFSLDALLADPLHTGGVMHIFFKHVAVYWDGLGVVGAC